MTGCAGRSGTWRVLIAYSGGVDSTFLLAVAARELGPRGVLAVTAVSETYPSSELTAAKSLAKKLGAAHTIIRTAELRNPVFSANPPDRCFHCKDELFGKLTRLARRRHMTLVDANNYSDRGDYRPGRRAALKWGVRSPLDESRMTKEDIRAGSRALGLPTWNAPAQACLASRIPYGTELSAAILRRIEAGEAQLRRAGFVVFRLRHHGDVARIEVAPGELKKFGKPAVRNAVVRALKRLGWRFVSVDLEGYRCGSLNPPRARAGA
jgi:uncharacterized protein